MKDICRYYHNEISQIKNLKNNLQLIELIGCNTDSIFKKVDAAKRFLELLSKPVDNLYFSMNQILGVQIIYFDGLFVQDMTNLCNSIESFGEEFWTSQNCNNNKEVFVKFEKMYHDAYDKGNFDSIDVLVDKRFREFIRSLFKSKMSSEQLYWSFVHTNKITEPQNLKREAKKAYMAMPSKVRKAISDFKGIEQNGELTIYRGSSSHSTPFSKAISWTTDEKTAERFAVRFETSGTVYTGIVKAKDIIYIYDLKLEDSEDEDNEDDSEHEVLVLPGSVRSINKREVTRG